MIIIRGGEPMLLKPPVSEEAAFEWLKARAVEDWQTEMTPQREQRLRDLARSMARVSEVDLPEEIEPLFL
jgi:hypothetical protein